MAYLSACASLIALLLLYSHTCNAARATPREPDTTNFIRSSCKSTMYPTLCYASLSPHASTIQISPIQLAATALSVSLDGAQAASAAIKRMSATSRMSRRDAGAMSDCVENVGDSVEELRKSIGAMGKLGGRDLGFQLDSIKTWVSAAIADENSCMDGFAGGSGGVGSAVRAHVVNVAQLTSNALDLIVHGIASSTHSMVSP